MWQRFTERSRRTVYFSQEEASRLGQAVVEPAHILLGLLRERDTIAVKLLTRLGADLSRLRRRVERSLPAGPPANSGVDMSLSASAKSVIDYAFDEARELDQNYIGTEHLLLGLTRVGDVVSVALAEEGANWKETRAELEKLLQDFDGEGGEGETARPIGGPPSPLNFNGALANLPESLWNRLCGDGLPVAELPDDARAAVLDHFGIRSDNSLVTLTYSRCVLRLSARTPRHSAEEMGDAPTVPRVETWEVSLEMTARVTTLVNQRPAPRT